MGDRDEVVTAVAAGGPVRLNGAELAGVDLTGLDLGAADLSYADLHGARLDRSVLRGARLWSVHARGASFRECDLRDADLRTADLTDADLSRARLVGARLDGTTLTGALLEGAELPSDGTTGAAFSPAPVVTGNTAAGSPGGEGSAGGRAHVLLEVQDDGRDVQLAVAGVLEVALPEGATGYQWVRADGPQDVLAEAGAEMLPPGDTAPGAFGRRVFRYSAVAPGSVEVNLRLVQPWDPDATPAQTFAVRVQVQ